MRSILSFCSVRVLYSIEYVANTEWNRKKEPHTPFVTGEKNIEAKYV